VKEQGHGVNFHSPNGLHARYIDSTLAFLLKETGFIMPRLSLETSNTALQKATGSKVYNEEFLAAASYLKEAGYRSGEYAAYIMAGLLNQEFRDIEQTMRFAHDAGARISLAEYSPIPGTRDWELIKDRLPSPDPLWHNNSIFPVLPLNGWNEIQKLKDMSVRMNKCFT